MTKQEDNLLAVITDQANGQEYYVSIIDAFEFRNQEYSVMYHYQDDLRRNKDAEIVIMKSYKAQDGSRYFTSIREEKELELVFELFYQRYRGSKREE